MLDATSMEGSRDGTRNRRPSEELDDDGGLELSLGLSCGGSQNKWKASEASSPETAADVTAQLGEDGSGISQHGRGNGLEAALKKFLEGPLDEQEESGRLLDGYSQKQGVWELSGSFNKEEVTCSTFNFGLDSKRAPSSYATQVNQEPSGQPDSVSDLDSRVTSIPFQEIQLSSAFAAAWRQLPHQGMPMHFMDANIGSSAAGPAAGSATLLPHLGRGHGDQDIGELQLQTMVQHDGLEQQRKFQEARKKRKHLVEEQKQQKKVKKEEDRSGPHGFRRPGSNTWVRVDAAAPALDVDRFSAVSENEEGEQGQQETARDMKQEWEDVKGKDFENKQGDSNVTPGENPHNNGSEQRPISANDTPAPGNHPLYRAASLNYTQDPVLAFCQPHQEPDLRFLSSLSVAAVPHFGPLRTLSDPGELRSFKEQVGINAFPGFAASVQVAQGLPGVLMPPASMEAGDGRHEHLTIGKGGTAGQQHTLHSEDSNATEGNNSAQEDIGQAFEGFHRESTDKLPVSDGLSHELMNLRPGVTPGMKFGGTGSCPDLPWVSTTGTGPSGKTVCGVLYKFSRSEVKIVCACHGKHMSPSEFVQHAGGVDVSNPEKSIVVNPFRLTSQADATT